METVPYFPEDIVMIILSWLPVKYLMQYKCVCKLWLSLITDPLFAKLQFAHTKDNSSCQQLLCFTARPKTINCEAFGDDLVRAPVRRLKYPHMMKKLLGNEKYADIAMPCNGLVCAVFPGGQCFLWNPTIGEALELPNICDFNPFDKNVRYGFGYDFSIDDFKLLRGYCRCYQYPNVHSFEILTLKSNIWRKVEKQPDYFFLQSGIFLCGALHWVAVRRIQDSKAVILVFDMVKEKFRELVELPYGISEHHGMVLTNSGDRLIIFREDMRSNDLEVWQLNEYGVKSSWTKIFSNYKCSFYHTLARPVLYYTKTGKIVFDYGKRHIVLHDPKENTWKACNQRPKQDLCLRAVYVESLIPPDWYRPTDKIDYE